MLKSTAGELGVPAKSTSASGSAVCQHKFWGSTRRKRQKCARSDHLHVTYRQRGVVVGMPEKSGDDAGFGAGGVLTSREQRSLCGSGRYLPRYGNVHEDWPTRQGESLRIESVRVQVKGRAK
jgi:hypothetical protein